MDDTGVAAHIFFKSYMSRSITRSVLTGEIIDFSDLIDDTFGLLAQIEQFLNQYIPLHLLNDSKSLFDILTKGARTNESRFIPKRSLTSASFEMIRT